MYSFGRILIFIMLLIIAPVITNAQQTNFAVIADPLIGTQNSETNLKSVVDNINSRADLDFVIIFGSISSDGSFSKLNTADNILSKLKIPYYVSPGINDISNSVNGGIDYFQTIGGDGFSFNYATTIFMSINPSLPFNTDLKRFSINENRWVNDFISSSGKEDLFLFCPVHPLDIQNKNDLLNVLSRIEYPVIFSFSENQYSREKFEGIELIKLSSINEKNPAYTLIRLEHDTTYIFQRTITDKADLLIDHFPREILSMQSFQQKTETIFESDVTIKKIIQLKETHLAQAYHNDGLIYTASKDGMIVCFDESGNQKWDYYAGGTMYHSPVRFRDILAAAIFEGDLITLNANNGDVLQIIGMSSNISGAPMLIDIVHNGFETKGIIITTVSDEIFCYELFSLELVWSQKSIKGRITSAPLQQKNVIIFINTNGEVFALNADSGTLIWKYKIPGVSGIQLSAAGPLSDGSSVYVLYGDNIAASIDLLLGTQKWINNSVPHQYSFTITPEGQLLVKGKDNNYILLSSSDGKLIKSFPSYSRNYFPNNFVNADGWILNGTSEGDVVLIDKNASVTRLFNSYDAPIVSLSLIKPGSFLSLDIDGNLIFFDLQQLKE